MARVKKKQWQIESQPLTGKLAFAENSVDLWPTSKSERLKARPAQVWSEAIEESMKVARKEVSHNPQTLNPPSPETRNAHNPQTRDPKPETRNPQKFKPPTLEPKP